MTIEEVLSKMNNKIAEVKERAALKRPFLAASEQEKLDKILAKTVDVVNEVSKKVGESANNLGQGIDVDNFFSGIINKCNEACNYTINKINNLKESNESSDNKQKLDELGKEITQLFDGLKANEGLKKIIDNLKSTGSELASSVGDFVNKKETQESINKAKSCILKAADSANNKLHSLLDKKEEN